MATIDAADANPEARDEQYDSEEDEDFNPAAAEAQDDDLSPSSADEDEGPPGAVTAKTHKGSRKRKPAPIAVDEELDSGDEATIQELKRKRRKKQDQEDSGGEGGLIKTRAQRAAEKQERAEFRRSDKGRVTVDVDSLWAKLSSVPIGRRQLEAPPPETSEVADGPGDTVGLDQDQGPPDSADDDGMITINRSYNYAGQEITEEKRVHKSSAEAKLWLASHDPSKLPQKDSTPPEPHTRAEDGPRLRRPLRRASRFEPNPTGEVKGLPLDRQRLRAPTRADVLAQQQRKEEEDKRKGKVQKLTTVQKSAIDWAAHVDREGLKEELDIYGRSKQGFMGRMEFMRGVEGRKEAEEREARLATSAATATASS